MTTEISYWHGNAQFQNEYDTLFNDLVPVSGSCEVLEGEFIRAISKLTYDHFNNGNLNNTSGPAKFLIANHSVFASGNKEVLVALFEVYDESNLGHYTMEDLAEPLTLICDTIVQYVLSKNGDYTDFDGCMYNWSEDDRVEDYDEEGEYFFDEDEIEW